MSDYSESLRQQARWIREALDPDTPKSQRIGLEDVDLEELDGAADEIASLRAQVAAAKDGNKTLLLAMDLQEQRHKAQLASARKALAPFAAVAEHDIGADEVDSDIFMPMREPHNRAPRLRVGHLRAAKAALTDELREVEK